MHDHPRDLCSGYTACVPADAAVRSFVAFDASIATKGPPPLSQPTTAWDLQLSTGYHGCTGICSFCLYNLHSPPLSSPCITAAWVPTASLPVAFAYLWVLGRAGWLVYSELLALRMAGSQRLLGKLQELVLTNGSGCEKSREETNTRM